MVMVMAGDGSLGEVETRMTNNYNAIGAGSHYSAY